MEQKIEKALKDECFEVVVEKKKSKNKEGKFFHALYVKFDYGVEYVSFDLEVISRLSDMSVRQLQKLEVDKPVRVATYILG